MTPDRTDLNPQQAYAAAQTEGVFRVLAGAGTGKTRTLVHRVAHLVRSGVEPSEILLLTFTRRAAQEMLRRAAGLLDQRCESVHGGTFHAFAHRSLREFAEPLGFGSNFTILDRLDAVDTMRSVREEGGFARSERRFPRAETLVDLFSKQRNTGAEWKVLLARTASQFVEDEARILEVCALYQARKRENNVLDYDDLLTELLRLLTEIPAARKALAERHRFVMVDEFQDTNRIQAHITALLAATHGNLMVVGDDAQSIYGFRGSEVRNILDFAEVFSGCETILLEDNYRSYQGILDLANGILERSRENTPKQLRSARDSGGSDRPRLVRLEDEPHQAQYVAEEILRLRETGSPLRKMAVLFRAAWHSAQTEIELQRRNIPYRKFGGLRFVESAHIKDVAAILKVAVNPRDSLSWSRILQLFPGIGQRTAADLIRRLLEPNVEPRAILPHVPPKSGEQVSNLLDLLADLNEPSASVAERMEKVVARYEEWMKDVYDDAARRAQDLEALAGIAGSHRDLTTLLADLALDPPGSTRVEVADQEDEWITLSTIHSAKGLEWETVFLLDLNDGRFPRSDFAA